MRLFVTDFAAAAISIAITAGAVAVATPAFASAASVDADAPRQAMVLTGDLDLGTTAGRKIAARRINHAADAVCSSPLPGFAVDRGCRAKAIASATSALDARIASLASAPIAIASR